MDKHKSFFKRQDYLQNALLVALCVMGLNKGVLQVNRGNRIRAHKTSSGKGKFRGGGL